MPSSYEAHRHPDPQLPVLFHLDTVLRQPDAGFLHWHEAIELLFCVEGEGVVIADAERLNLREGELAVVNSNRLHCIYSAGLCRYYCLIASPSLFGGLDLPSGEAPLRTLVRDERIGRLFDSIAEEMREQNPYYRSAVRAAILSLYLLLYRDYPGEFVQEPGKRANNRLGMVKEAVAVLQRRYTQELTMDDICREVGFSKYYLSHAFKEVTGQTIVGYLNFLRCRNARSLLATGQYNIGESAEQSGFHNLSYFTRTYKMQMGELPSDSIRRQRARD